MLNLQEQSKVKDECDNSYSIRMSEKDENSPHRITSRRRDSLNHPQRSSASPTSNIWLRLIEDEENIGNVIFQHLVFTSSLDLPIPHPHPPPLIHIWLSCLSVVTVHIMLLAPNSSLAQNFPVDKIPSIQYAP